MFCIANLESLDEIFKVFAKYEQATNAKLNKAKNGGLIGGYMKK